MVTWIAGEIGGNPHFHILFSILCTVSVYGVPPPQVMSVFRSGDNGYERAGSQYPCPLLPNLDKEGVRSWRGVPLPLSGCPSVYPQDLSVAQPQPREASPLGPASTCPSLPPLPGWRRTASSMPQGTLCL